MARSYFRRSKKIGPFRLTASKSGLSYSIGGKGARLTRRTDGKVQSTIGVPGSGFRVADVHGSSSGGPGSTSTRANHLRIAEQVPTSLPAWKLIAVFLGAFIVTNGLLGDLFGNSGPTVAVVLSVGAVIGSAVWYRKRQRGKIEALKAEHQRQLAEEARRREELARVRPEPRLFKTTREAEVLARDWIRYFGYIDAEVTEPGPDGGIDVESDSAVAQVKTNAQKVGRPVVQQTFGAAAAVDKQAIVFALAGFTTEAEEWATANGVALFEFDHSGGIQTLNPAADAMLQEGDRRRLG